MIDVIAVHTCNSQGRLATRLANVGYGAVCAAWVTDHVTVEAGGLCRIYKAPWY
eukprot:COSAG02_NODE_5965_length_3905_cov_2.134524_1_plen_53_part_10